MGRALALALVVCLASLAGSRAAPAKGSTPAQELAGLVAGLNGLGLTSFASVAASSGFAAGLPTLFKQKRRLTILAPTNAALAKFDPTALPCRDDTTPRITNRFIRTTLGLHTLVGYYPAISALRADLGQQFKNLSPMLVSKLSQSTNTTIYFGVISGIKQTAYTSAKVTTPDAYKTPRVVVHVIDNVLAYPYQWTGF